MEVSGELHTSAALLGKQPLTPICPNCMWWQIGWCRASTTLWVGMVPLVEKCLVSRHCCLTAKPKENLLTLRLRVFTDYIFLIHVEWYLFFDVFKILLEEHLGKRVLGSHILIIMLVTNLRLTQHITLVGKLTHVWEESGDMRPLLSSW